MNQFSGTAIRLLSASEQHEEYTATAASDALASNANSHRSGEGSPATKDAFRCILLLRM